MFIRKVFLNILIFLGCLIPIALIGNQSDISIFNIEKNQKITPTDVSTMEEFFTAANNNEDINIIDDIDFSTATAEDYLISGYSGNIEGNNHIFSNGLIEEDPDPNHIFYYLFDDFTGTIRNLTLDNFPFFARTLIHTTMSSTPDIQNIAIRNMHIDGFKIEKTIDNSDEIVSLYIGIFSEYAENYYLSDFSIINSSISNNEFYFYGSGTNRIDISIGYVIGRLDTAKLEKSYLIGNQFNNNIIEIYNNSGTTEINNGVLELGCITGRSNNSELNQNFVNNFEIIENNFILGYVRWGGICGYANGIILNQNYVSLAKFYNNTAVALTQFQFSGLIGGINPAEAYTFGFTKNVTSNEYITNNQWSTELGGTYEEVTPSEFGNSVTEKFDASDKNYYVGEGISDSSINYISSSALTSAFWTEIIDYDSTVWNLSTLVDENMQIVTSSSIPGYPIFLNLNYLNTSIDSTGTNYEITLNNIVSNQTDALVVKSVFGDDISVNLNQSNTIDTGISTSYFAESTAEEINTFLNTNFWLETSTSDTFVNTIIIGDFNNFDSSTYEEPTMKILNEITSSDAGYTTITFAFEHSQDMFILDNISDYEVLSVDSNYGSVPINFVDENTITVPDYLLSNLNDYYQLTIPNSDFNYIAADKSMQTKAIDVEGEITNTTTAPLALDMPQIQIDTNYSALTKQLTVELSLTSNETSFVLDATDLENSSITITSTFYEFDESNSKTIALNEFTPQGNTLTTTIDLMAEVEKSMLNDFYSIEFNSSFKYYSDLEYGTSLITDFNFTGDLTNTDSTSIGSYDTTESFEGLINTQIEANQIKLTFSKDFAYLTSYEINLIIETSNVSENITFNQESSNEFYIDIDPALITYYNQLSDEDKVLFNINDYYKIDFNSEQESYITFINSSGILETSTIDQWVVIEPRAINQELKLTGDITNTGTIIEVPEVIITPPPVIEEDTNDNINQLILIIILALLLLVIILVAIIHRKTFKVKEKKLMGLK